MPLNEVLNFADRVALGFADEGQTRKVGKVSSPASTTVPLLLHGKYKRIKVSFEHSLVLQNFTDNVAIGHSSRCELVLVILHKITVDLIGRKSIQFCCLERFPDAFLELWICGVFELLADLGVDFPDEILVHFDVGLCVFEPLASLG